MEVPLTAPQRRSGQLSPSGQSPSCSRPGGRRQGRSIRHRTPYDNVAAAAVARAHGCRCSESACLTAASVGYEGRLVPHRRGGGDGGGGCGGGGERLGFTQARARLPIGGGTSTVRRQRCTLHSADKCLTGWGAVHRVHPLKKCWCNMCLEVGEHGAHSTTLTLTTSVFSFVQTTLDGWFLISIFLFFLFLLFRFGTVCTDAWLRTLPQLP